MNYNKVLISPLFYSNCRFIFHPQVFQKRVSDPRRQISRRAAAAGEQVKMASGVSNFLSARDLIYKKSGDSLVLEARTLRESEQRDKGGGLGRFAIRESASVAPRLLCAGTVKYAF